MPVRMCLNMSFIRALLPSALAHPAVDISGREATEKEWLGSLRNGVSNWRNLPMGGPSLFEPPGHEEKKGLAQAGASPPSFYFRS